MVRPTYPGHIGRVGNACTEVVESVHRLSIRGLSLNEDGHRQALDELRASRAKLDPAADLRLYVEACHGMAIHAVAAGFLRRHGLDHDQHQGMVATLRGRGHLDAAASLAEVERLRAGRWYGRQGDGGLAHALDDLVRRLEAWSLA
ncbi:MAG TPA: hypothetical protein VG370_30315 [Chloroflexota bacterium]|nr:hypothetical protein [Chloroflexota bacterium]